MLFSDIYFFDFFLFIFCCIISFWLSKWLGWFVHQFSNLLWLIDWYVSSSGQSANNHINISYTIGKNSLKSFHSFHIVCRSSSEESLLYQVSTLQSELSNLFGSIKFLLFAQPPRGILVQGHFLSGIRTCMDWGGIWGQEFSCCFCP